MNSLEERERKRERKLVAKGLLRKTEEEERQEKRRSKQELMKERLIRREHLVDDMSILTSASNHSNQSRSINNLTYETSPRDSKLPKIN